MVSAPFVFQVAGYQNSGKTTFVNKIITRLSEQKFRAATIKHHGHGGKPELNEMKDSSQHISSGAFASIVEGDGRLILHAEQTEWTVDEQISILSHFDLDLIIIEGHKKAYYPKVIILKELEDEKLLTLTNIQAVLYWNKEVKELESSYPSVPFFAIQDIEGEEWIMDYLVKKVYKN
ncbi:molybdopterin-guanine dinucleotide biosynthesis protein B [Cytobacillus depressus]|uniref:Molybdopterin-guanine dinucleotide biosynthesis protein B n=1 Tax=Cytobacillus depressus TaxID=1602942 RepID=A0A6L3VB06_9BACI|nr:molybdopterin-guanine dinucleotide biosynthesis protein B [Cytobacillus depressus]KAB2337709.1 molybdopterin-guanine dinucleotide biosynthesis protein B [Cytobacillus depressus]